LRSFCSSSVSQRAIVDDRARHRHHVERDRSTYFTGAGKSSAEPSWVSSAATLDHGRGLTSQLLDAASPEPDTAW